MARQELELAKDLIAEKQYDKARMLLMKVKEDPTAQKWLEKLEELSPVKVEQATNDERSDNDSSAWQYAALEVKRAYGIQYRVNGEARQEWKDQPIYYALNQLGREGWEMISMESINEFSVYILKRPGTANVKKIDVWDQ